MKLIKINTDHYVVVDDSEIKEGDWYYDLSLKQIFSKSNPEIKKIDWQKKITHSTQPLGVKPITDKVVIQEDKDGKPLMSAQYVELDMSCTVKPLSLQEVKELIGELDVEKKIYALCQSECIVDDYGKATDDGMVIGIRAYNQALEDNKDKKYTEEDLLDAWELGAYVGLPLTRYKKETLFKAVQPKTEWEVCFVDGKLKLK